MGKGNSANSHKLHSSQACLPQLSVLRASCRASPPRPAAPPPPSSTGAANANRVSFWSQPRKMRRRPPYCVFTKKISTMPIIHSPSVLGTQKIAIWVLPCTGSAGSELVTRQTVCFKIYRSLGRVSWGVGTDKPPCTYLVLAAKKNNFMTKRLVLFKAHRTNETDRMKPEKL